MINRRTLFKIAGTSLSLVLVPHSEIFAKTPGKHYVMVFDVRRCTGCISCTVSCSQENNVPYGRQRTDVVQVPIVDPNGNISTLPLPHQCNQCDNPPCVSVCPVKATYNAQKMASLLSITQNAFIVRLARSLVPTEPAKRTPR